ncbi:hypothetical protein LHYA1_G004716 [Lachnellula hyalina]|uniref:Uncharacterized protein n=1 Tax=Lachnellula hyalina TaxID=1316788 RepID=A0A8H8R299_9HELO|nr:uncharacterized protein LHYA1_G004716 [Lachnellula hyalina]TVY26746.1 hypothetical protein LHYA1_G004716 [Lachnellula hyalina]
MASEKGINIKDKLEAQVKSADMTDDMQQEAIDVANGPRNRILLSTSRRPCVKLQALRILDPTADLLSSLMSARDQPGTALLDVTSAPSSPTRPSTSSTSTWATAPSSFSRHNKRLYLEFIPVLVLEDGYGGDGWTRLLVMEGLLWEKYCLMRYVDTDMANDKIPKSSNGYLSKFKGNLVKSFLFP